MQPGSTPTIKDIVLVGGGHAHVTVLRRFGMSPLPGVRLTVISPEAHTPYSGMLPGLIAGHYTYDQAHIDLIPLCRFARARFILGDVVRVEPDLKLVHVRDRPPIPYDLLSINSGSTPDPSKVPGALGRTIPVKPVASFLNDWDALKARILQNPSRRIGTIGAGAGGVELLLSGQFAIDKMLESAGIADRPSYHLFTQGRDILTTHNPRVRQNFRNILESRKIELHTNFLVNLVNESGIHSPTGESIRLDEILWVTGANAAAWIAESGFDTDQGGFISVGPDLQSISCPDVFAAGDAAHVVGYPRPKSGVFAVRQGLPLAKNLRRAALGRPPRTFRPQSAFLSLISTGGKHAVASRSSWCLTGDWVWRWKDTIDRSFMRKFNELPKMGSIKPALSIDKLPPELNTLETQTALGPQDMRCGGCGAKVGATILTRVLGGIKTVQREDVLWGLDSPDDAAAVSASDGKIIVQSIDYFRSMIDDPFIFAKIAANHSLGDLYAMGAEPQSALALATLPPGLPRKTEDLLMQIMAGGTEILNAANCALVGGHTSEGLELSLGFSVTGLVDPDQVLRKSGAGRGDALILTKPLGTGALFAAEMLSKAKGRWVQAAIQIALQSNRDASRIAHAHGATACTDITGFGLAGHLLEILDASAASAHLELTALPLIDGVNDVLASGVRSTLHEANALQRKRISGEIKDKVAFQALFDPQTAGGLLVTVPENAAEDCLADLRANGYAQATCIGQINAVPVKEPAIEI
ncbi:MAG: selenide, water dikinase SelD [Hyphomicrobiaceae bacterium]